LIAKVESNFIITLSFRELKQGAFMSGFKHYRLVRPRHVFDVARVPIADVLVEGGRVPEQSGQGIAAQVHLGRNI